MAAKRALSKVSPEWKKRVCMEYAKLREQKNVRHQDDIKMAWISNRSLINKRVKGETERAATKHLRSRPMWPHK